MTTGNQEFKETCAELSGSFEKVGSLETVLHCSRGNIASVKKIVAEHTEPASVNVAGVGEMKDVLR